MDPPRTGRASSDEGEGWWTRGGVPVLIGGGFVIAVVGAILGRATAPAPTGDTQQPRRPIVQIVRSQGALPSIADTIDRLCPSMGMVVVKGASPSAPKKLSTATPRRKSKSPPITQTAAFAISADGWLITSAELPDASHLDVVFSDGSRAAIKEIRKDPVSGIAVAKADATDLSPLTMEDQAFARVGDFGFILRTPNASGCTADVSMVGGDFLSDSAGRETYFRLQSSAPMMSAGEAFLSGDGRVVGVASAADSADNMMLPAPVAATIIDELIRGSSSPTTIYGFRATDFTTGLSARVGDTRSRGAGVAVVRPKSAADKAGLDAGDVIVAVDGSPVSSASELGRNLDGVEKSAKLDIIRGDQRMTLKITRPAV